MTWPTMGRRGLAGWRAGLAAWRERLPAIISMEGGSVTVALMAAVIGLWPSAGWSVRTGKLALWEIATIAGLALMIRARPLRWLLWLTVLVLPSIYNARSLVTCWRLTLAALTIELIASRIGSRADAWAMVLRSWRAITMINTGLMLIQMQGIIYPFFTVLQYEPSGAAPIVGFLDNQGLAGAYTAITLPLFAHGWTRLAWLVPSLWAIAATQSLGAMVVAGAMVLGMAWACWGWGPWRSALIAGLLVSAYGVHVEPIHVKVLGERSNRLIVWREAIGMANQTPRSRWVGWGPGQFEPAFRGIGTHIPILKGYGLRWDKAHNEWVQGLFEFGRIGLVLIAWMIWRWVRAGWRAARQDPAWTPWALMSLGWLLVACYHFAAHHPSLAMVGILLAGAMEASARRRPIGFAP